MNKEEANKIIAEYMGYRLVKCDDMGFDTWEHDTNPSYIDIPNTPHYVSLDALVPVWEKLKVDRHSCSYALKNEVCFTISHNKLNNIEQSFGNTMSEAAANATAKVIKAIDIT